MPRDLVSPRSPDILGAVGQGLAIRQAFQKEQNKEKLVGLQQAQLSTRQNALGVPNLQPENESQEDARMRMFADNPGQATKIMQGLGIVSQQQKEEAANFADSVLNASNEQDKTNLIKQRVVSLSKKGRNPTNTMDLLGAEPGRRDEALSSLKAAALTELQRTAQPAKQDALDLKRQALELRRSESKLRAMDQSLKRETNTLKREELQLKITEKRRKVDQAKKDRDFSSQSSIDEVNNSIGTIERMLQGGKLESASGIEANFPTIAGTEAATFEGMLETLQSQAFLTQVEKMKGLGALSENEGKKLGAAIGSLDIRMQDATLRSELKRILVTMNAAKSKLKKKFGISANTTTDKVQQVGRFKVEVVE